MRRPLPLLLAALLSTGAAAQERTIRLTAERYKFTPSTVELKLGEAVVLELTSLDRKHGFQVPDLGIDESIEPGKVTRVRLLPARAGAFPFHCDIFCGGGHEEMTGQIVVQP